MRIQRRNEISAVRVRRDVQANITTASSITHSDIIFGITVKCTTTRII